MMDNPMAYDDLKNRQVEAMWKAYVAETPEEAPIRRWQDRPPSEMDLHMMLNTLAESLHFLVGHERLVAWLNITQQQSQDNFYKTGLHENR